jgi:hypothetical protein
MKNIIVSILTLLLISFTFEKGKTPPGTVRVYNDFYFDINSVKVSQWLDYMNWIMKKYGADSKEYDKCKVDKKFLGTFYSERDHTLVWVESLGESSEMRYVSKQQAIDYCKWRTDRINELIFIKKEKIDIEDLKKNKENYIIPNYVKYRLPYLAEWKNVVEIGYSKREIISQEKGYQDYIKNKNTKASKYCFMSGIENKKGISGISGGVSEFINDNDYLTIGMGCKHREINIEGHVLNTIQYEGPNSYTGFRCVAEKLIEY